jgi:hypothetical protein
MNIEIQSYNNQLESVDREICNQLATIIDNVLTQAENKI